MIESTETTLDDVENKPTDSTPTPPNLPAADLPSQQKLVARPGQPRRAMTSGD